MMSEKFAYYQDVYSKQLQQKIGREFERLKDLCYLDHTGSTLYASSQISAVAQDLCENVYGNPHSLSISSRYTSDVIDQVRYQVLKHFNTDPNEYSVVFTSGATQALKIIAESFDWMGKHSVTQNIDHILTDDENILGCIEKTQHKYDGTPGTFMYLQDNHTSVLGMRELAAENGARIECISHDDAFEKLSCKGSHTENKYSAESFSGNSLFAYPAQCNFSGVKYPLSWTSSVQGGIFDQCKIDKNGSNEKFRQSKWFCLLDAATFASTNFLDMSLIQPDFVCLSFYKIFGYPTGLGALLIKNSSAHVLHKVFFGGGTVLISLSSRRFHISRPILHDKFEDGTISFLSIMSLRHGFHALRCLTTDMSSIARHSFSLAQYVHHRLLVLHHANGLPVAILYADTNYENIETQGNIVNFNLLRPDGEYVGFMEVLNMANLHNIHLRTGCFCNPGACQRHLGLSIDDLQSHFQAGHVCGDDKDLIDGHPTGSVRISFGYMSTKGDADKFLTMIQDCFVQGKPVCKTPDWWDSFTKVYNRKFQITNRLENNVLHIDAQSKITNKSLFSKSIINEINASLNKDISLSSKSAVELSNYSGMFLSHIFLYPVKSCGALSVANWIIGPRGLEYDREWMIVTPSGVSLTQKQDSRLCLITPKIDLVKQVLRLHFPGVSPFFLPLNNENGTGVPDSEGSLCQSKVCGDRVQGWDCGDDVALWLSEALERDGLRLIRQWNSDQRTAKSKRKTEKATDRQTILSLSNQAQFLLLNSASVDWLAERLSEDADCSKTGILQRFRSNLVIQGVEPFSENNWTGVQIGCNQFQSEGPCTRCQMVCIDQSTGEKTREPLKTLAATFHGKMRFGVYLSHVSDGEYTEITTGDPVSLRGFDNIDCNVSPENETLSVPHSSR